MLPLICLYDFGILGMKARYCWDNAVNTSEIEYIVTFTSGDTIEHGNCP